MSGRDVAAGDDAADFALVNTFFLESSFVGFEFDGPGTAPRRLLTAPLAPLPPLTAESKASVSFCSGGNGKVCLGGTENKMRQNSRKVTF